MLGLVMLLKSLLLPQETHCSVQCLLCIKCSSRPRLQDSQQRTLLLMLMLGMLPVSPCTPAVLLDRTGTRCVWLCVGLS